MKKKPKSGVKTNPVNDNHHDHCISFSMVLGDMASRFVPRKHIRALEGLAYEAARAMLLAYDSSLPNPRVKPSVN